MTNESAKSPYKISEPRKGPFKEIPRIIPLPIGTGKNPTISPSQLTNVATNPRQSQLNVSSTDERARLIFGRYRVGAVIPWAGVYAINYLVIVCLWGRTNRAGYDAIESFTMGNKALPSGCLVNHYLGTQTTPDSLLVAAMAAQGVTFTSALTGICYSVVQLPSVDSSSQPVNIDSFNAIIRGSKCYDPRDVSQSYATPSTWLYSNNPAIVVANLLTEADIGIGCTPDAAFWTSVTAAANYDDETLTGGGLTKRYSVNIALQNYAPAETHIKAIGQYGSFLVIPEGNSFRFLIDKTETAGVTITAANMIDDTFSSNGIDALQRPNLIYIRYTRESYVADWTTALAPAGSDIPSIPTGEDRRVSMIDMPGILSYDQALRTAKLLQNHLYLEDVQMTFQMPQSAIGLFVSDVRPITKSVFAAKPMRLMSVVLNKLGFFDTTWKEYDPAAYSNVYTTTPTFADTALPDPFAVPPAVTGLMLVEAPSTNDATPAPLSRIVASWMASNSPYISGYQVQITDNAAPPAVRAIYYETFVQGTTFTSPPLASPKKYGVSVKVISSTGVKSMSTDSAITLLLSTIKYDQYATLTCSYASGQWSQTGFTLQRGFTFECNGPGGAYSVDTYSQYPTADYLTASGPPVDDSFTGPILDIGSVQTVTLMMDTFATFSGYAGSFGDRMFINIKAAGESGVFADGGAEGIYGSAFDGRAIVRGRYFRLYVTGKVLSTTIVSPTYSRQVRTTYRFSFVDGNTLKVLMPITDEPVAFTTSATAAVTVPLANRYIKFIGAQATAQSSTEANPSYDTPIIGESVVNKIDVNCYASAARIVKSGSLVFFGLRGNQTTTNWALTANGATITSSGDISTAYPASSAFDGNRSGATWGAGGGWNSSTNTGTRTLTTTFASAKSITAINIITLQDAYATSANPRFDTTFTSYGVTAATVEWYNGSAWATVATYSGNNLVLKQLTGLSLAGVLAVRINVTGSPDGYARVVEFECIGPA